MPPKGGKSKTELRAEQAAAEEARLLKEKMDAAGLSYVDTADPDDEVEVCKRILMRHLNEPFDVPGMGKVELPADANPHAGDSGVGDGQKPAGRTG